MAYQATSHFVWLFARGQHLWQGNFMANWQHRKFLYSVQFSVFLPPGLAIYVPGFSLLRSSWVCGTSRVQTGKFRKVWVIRRFFFIFWTFPFFLFGISISTSPLLKTWTRTAWSEAGNLQRAQTGKMYQILHSVGFFSLYPRVLHLI